jgi:hypothetical protein
MGYGAHGEVLEGEVAEVDRRRKRVTMTTSHARQTAIIAKRIVLATASDSPTPVNMAT